MSLTGEQKQESEGHLKASERPLEGNHPGMTTPSAKLGLRRLRLNPLTRELVRDVRLAPAQFIQPHFVVAGLAEREAVSGLPGVYRETPATLLEQIAADLEKGINKVLLFGVPADKAEAAFDFGFTASQVAAIRSEFGSDVWLATDLGG